MVEQHFRRLSVGTRAGYILPAGTMLGTADGGDDVRTLAAVIVREVLRDATGWFVAYHPVGSELRSAA